MSPKKCLKVSLHTPPGMEQREDPFRDVPKFNAQTHPGCSCPAPAQGEIGLIRSPCCLQASRVKCPVINQRKFCHLFCLHFSLGNQSREANWFSNDLGTCPCTEPALEVAGV